MHLRTMRSNKGAARFRHKLLIVNSVKLILRNFFSNHRPRNLSINLQGSVEISPKMGFCLEEKCKYLRTEIKECQEHAFVLKL